MGASYYGDVSPVTSHRWTQSPPGVSRRGIDHATGREGAGQPFIIREFSTYSSNYTLHTRVEAKCTIGSERL